MSPHKRKSIHNLGSSLAFARLGPRLSFLQCYSLQPLGLGLLQPLRETPSTGCHLVAAEPAQARVWSGQVHVVGLDLSLKRHPARNLGKPPISMYKRKPLPVL